MRNQDSGPFNEHFGDLPDPRIERTKRHKLIGIVVIAICAVICGADDWVEVEQFGESKEDRFRSFLELSNDIPSNDTFTRVFARLNPEAVRERFMEWMQAVSQITLGGDRHRCHFLPEGDRPEHPGPESRLSVEVKENQGHLYEDIAEAIAGTAEVAC